MKQWLLIAALVLATILAGVSLVANVLKLVVCFSSCTLGNTLTI